MEDTGESDEIQKSTINSDDFNVIYKQTNQKVVDLDGDLVFKELTSGQKKR